MDLDSKAPILISRTKRLMVLLPVIAVSSVFFINLCHLIYQCGCRSLWAGAEASCNIHAATGPHCPWCASTLAGGVGFVGVLAAQTAIVFMPARFFPGKAGLGWRGLGALLAFPIVGGLLGLIGGIATGYWS